MTESGLRDRDLIFFRGQVHLHYAQTPPTWPVADMLQKLRASFPGATVFCEPFDCGFAYGMAVSFEEGEIRSRNAVRIKSPDDIAAGIAALKDWCAEKGLLAA